MEKDWARLPNRKQDEIVARLVSEGVLKKQDTVVYKGPVVEPVETRMSPQMLAKLANRATKIVCQAKFTEDENACERQHAGSAKTQCVASVRERGKRSASCRR